MNTRLAVATHILTFLALRADHLVPSETIASSINTNARLVRKMLVHLNVAGLKSSAKGPGGGARLKRDPTTITLLEVFRAVDEHREMFRLHPSPNAACPVGKNISAVLQPHFDQAERTMSNGLNSATIADVATKVSDRVRR